MLRRLRFTHFTRAVFTAAYFILINPALAHNSHSMPHHTIGKHTHEELRNTLALTLTPQTPLRIGETTKIRMQITGLDDGEPAKTSDFKIVHEKRIHLLAIDSSLTDYHHLHPTPTSTHGEWTFDLTPRKEGSYRVWADVVPVQTGKQEYLQTDIGEYPFMPQGVDKSPILRAHRDGYTLTLHFDAPLVAGKDTIGRIKVNDRTTHRPVTSLEPIMGAFGHIVGFNEDGTSILHMHPMGPEPKGSRARGGPELQFHMGPQKSGLVKLFIQIRINKKERIIPLTLHIP